MRAKKSIRFYLIGMSYYVNIDDVVAMVQREREKTDDPSTDPAVAEALDSVIDRLGRWKVNFGGTKAELKKVINDRERSKGRSENYYDMTSGEQWAEDRRLNLLDWDGK
jgi:hypothetical protein